MKAIELKQHLRDILQGNGGWVVALLLFWACILRNVELPGLYMDAINPDYLVARWLNPELENPVWKIPGAWTLLGNLYHGTQTLYVGALTYSFLGTSVVSARVAQALFGAFIVLMAFLVVRKVTARPLVAMVTACALATDMAFIGSFRTQSYIILAGQGWMMLSLYLALPSGQRPPSHWLLLFSGVAMGLAVYGYFVFLFFLLPVAILAMCADGRQGALGRGVVWGLGFCIGMLPYVVGYIQLGMALGGVTPLLEWIQSALGGLQPTAGSDTYLDGLKSALSNVKLALSGGGNELMMINEQVSADFVLFRLLLAIIALSGCLVVAWLDWRSAPRLARAMLVVGVLPVAYVLAAAVFGSRLWMHHFTVLVALQYLAIGLFVAWLTQRLKALQPVRLLGLVLAVGLLVTNFVQQNRVHERLVHTGGVGMSTDALPALARAALTEKHSTVWFFPDWGFFMPFAFLTGNQVPYENAFSADSLGRHMTGSRDIRVAFWKQEDAAGHREILQDAGAGDIRLYRMDRRDGAPALYVLTAQVGAVASSAPGHR